MEFIFIATSTSNQLNISLICSHNASKIELTHTKQGRDQSKDVSC